MTSKGMKITLFLGPNKKELAELSFGSGVVHTAVAARATAAIEVSICTGTRAAYTTLCMTTNIDVGNGRLIGFAG